MSNWKTLTLALAENGVATLTMNRPEVFNAFDETMIGELSQAFAALAADAAVRVVVLAAAGKHFSAGADLQWMRRASEATQEWNLQDARRLADMLHSIATCPKPTLARVQGAALGGGVGLACACDLAIASAQASFTISEAKFGILPAAIGPYVVNAIGPRQAKRLALTARRIDAQTALSLGLVHEVVAADGLDAALAQTVDELLACSPNAQREIKTLLSRLPVGEVSAEVRELTASTISRVRGTEQAKEGFAAFLAKRPPAWAPQPKADALAAKA